MTVGRVGENMYRTVGRRPARRGRSAGVVGAALAFVLIVPMTASATEQEEPTIEERQAWSLEEAAEHDREFAGEVDLPDALPAHEQAEGDVSDALEVDVPDSRQDDAPVPVNAGEARLDIPAPGGDETRADVGGLPVHLEPVSGNAATGVLQVRTLEQAAATAVGVTALFTVEQGEEAGAAASGPVNLGVDYEALTGGNTELGSRLRLVELPACAVTTPEDAICQAQTPLDGQENDPANGQLAGVVDVTAEQALRSPDAAERAATNEVTVLAVAVDGSGSEGDWGATPLSGAASWDASGASGSFTWSYPLRTPGTAGGLTPEIGLSYDSGSVDGRVASTNAQTSTVGEGWELDAGGYVERKFVPCIDDQAALDGSAPNNASHDTGDLCWKNDNATLVLGGKATDLVKDVESDTWHLESDDNTKVEHLTGAWNTDDDKEYWKVTTTDGTQYWFGRDKRSATDTAALESSWTVPVFGNHPGEPCRGATYSASWCDQTWRWNLDHVVDTSGNTMTYYWTHEQNAYSRNNTGAATTYMRAGFLDKIEYGNRAGNLTAKAPVLVNFTYAERCIPTSTFDCGTLNASTRTNWPDVPQDRLCAITAETCEGRSSPSFFTRKRLTTVDTRLLQADATYRPVDSWALSQSFPDAGDGMDALWLKEITHKGVGGGDEVPLPATQFGTVQKANRVATPGAGVTAMNRMRIGEIRTESGAMITVSYGADCPAGGPFPSPESNTRRCMPVWWTPEGAEDPVMEWFHKYVVTKVSEDPRDGASDPKVTSYTYAGGAAWRYTADELTLKKHRTWSTWRGYETVDVHTGDTARNPGITKTQTRYRYFRGMHNDRLNDSGGLEPAQIDGIDDLDQWAGQTREEIVYNGAAVVSSTKTLPWRSESTATDADGDKAFYTGVEETETTTTAPERTGGNLVTRVVTKHDALGMPETVSDFGDTDDPSDNTCTRTTYTRNLTDHILETVRRVDTVDVLCSVTLSKDAVPDHVVADQKYAYDGGTMADAPTAGLVTLSQEVRAYNEADDPAYVDVERTTHDAFGRPLTSTDAKSKVTKTEYTTVQNLTTGTTVTSPDPDGTGALTAHETTTVIDPAWGTPKKVTAPDGRVTSGTYDALGRLTSVWEPGRVQGTDTATRTYAYTVRSTGVNAVTTGVLKYDGSGYLTSTALYDGLLRERQTQATSASDLATGRVITDTVYDTRGLQVVTNHEWHTTGAPSTSVLSTSVAVPGRTLTSYDGAGRVTAELFQVDEDAESTDNGTYIPRWTTTTEYSGDRVKVDPPTGGTPTTTITDGRGRTAELRQHLGAGTSSSFQATTYEYDGADRLIGATDSAGNAWSYEYDLRGRQIEASDPDKGLTTTTYDVLGNVATTKDARNQVLGYTYDALNRKTSLRDGGVDGTERAQWTYDRLADGTFVKGQLASSTRLQRDAAITTTVNGYEIHGQPTSTTVTIPSEVGGQDLTGVAGTWTTSFTYTVDGRLDKTTVPAGGGLPAETVNVTYDDANQASNLDAGVRGLYVRAADYAPTGEMVRLSLGNTLANVEDRDYQFGTRRLIGSAVVAQQSDGAAHDVRHAAFTWDDAGNLTSAFDTPAANLGGTTPDRQCFAYDGLRRLTSAWTPASAGCSTTPTVGGLGGAAPYWQDYTYYAVGDRKTTVEHSLPDGTASRTSTYAYPTAPTGTPVVQPHAVAEVTATGRDAGTSEFTYDEVGNMTGRAVVGNPFQELAWDPEGELDTAAEDSSGDGTVSDAETAAGDKYVYTADGDRLLRTQEGKTTLYLGTQELTVDHSTGSVAGLRYYTFAGQTVAVRTGLDYSTVSSIFSDRHGTGEVQIPNVTGARTHRYVDPFGAPRGPEAGGWTGDHGFLDKPKDATGLTAIGARMYDPVLGKFVSVDPVMDLADPQQWAPYSYSNNNPTTLSDPTGLVPDSGGGGGMYVAPPVSIGPSGAAVAPSVQNQTLKGVLDALYLRPGETPSVGTGTTAEALAHELKTGTPAKPVPGTRTPSWHGDKAANRLQKLSNLLREDRVKLSGSDRAIALREAEKLWRAFDTHDGPGILSQHVRKFPQQEATIRKGIEHASKSGALARAGITGASYSMNASGQPYVTGEPKFPRFYTQLFGLPTPKSGGTGQRSPRSSGWSILGTGPGGGGSSGRGVGLGGRGGGQVVHLVSDSGTGGEVEMSEFDWGDEFEPRNILVRLIPEISEEIYAAESEERRIQADLVRESRASGVADEWFESIPPLVTSYNATEIFVRRVLEPEIAGRRDPDLLSRCGQFIEELLSLNDQRDHIELEVLAFFEAVPGSWGKFFPYAGPELRKYVQGTAFP